MRRLRKVPLPGVLGHKGGSAALAATPTTEKAIQSRTLALRLQTGACQVSAHLPAGHVCVHTHTALLCHLSKRMCSGHSWSAPAACTMTNNVVAENGV